MASENDKNTGGLPALDTPIQDSDLLVGSRGGTVLSKFTWLSIKTAILGLFSPVATSGDYDDLSGKPNIPQTANDIGLGNVDNTSDAEKPISDLTQEALDLKLDASRLGAVSGVASLGADGKIPASQLPPLAINETFTVANQAAMLDLTAERGDVAIRTDLQGKPFILTADAPSVLANWVAIDQTMAASLQALGTVTPAADMLAYFTGAGTAAVTAFTSAARTLLAATTAALQRVALGLGNVDNTSDINKPVSTAQAAAIATSKGLGTANNPYDLLIYDGSFGGVNAARRAVDEGLSVILVSPINHIGGMVNSGIAFTDANTPTNRLRSTITGQVNKMYSDIANQEYGLDYQQFYVQKELSTESRRATVYINRMLKGVAVRKNCEVLSVEKDSIDSGYTISATFSNIGKVYFKQWIDAHYCLDFARMVGCSTIIGREAAATYGEATWNAGFTQSLGQPSTKANTALSWAAGVVTGTTAFVTQYVNGDTVNLTIAGATPAGYNIDGVTGTMTGPSSFTYPLAANPGANTVLGTVRFNVDAYVTPGVPGSGLIPFVSADPLLATGAAYPHVQNMGYRLLITDDAANKLAIPAPANYNPAMFEIHRRYAKAYGQAWTSATDLLLFQAAITSDWSNKRDVNNKNFVGLDYPHPTESTEYVTATKARRAEIDANILQYTLGLLYFFMNDTSIPAAARANMATYGLCLDEYPENGGIPPITYVREGPRIVGDFVTNMTHLITANTFADPVSQAYYTIDAHASRFLVGPGGRVVQEGTNGGFQASNGARIPASVKFPKKTESKNGQVICGGSLSRVAYNCTRLELNYGMIGESAGLDAALAIRRGNIPIQDVPNGDRQRYLDIYGWQNYGGASLAADGTATNKQDGVATPTGTWTSASTGQFGTNSLRFTTTAAASYKFAPYLKKSGMHDVYLKYSDAKTVDPRATPIVDIVANGVTTSIVVNQSNGGNGVGQYGLFLGSFFFKRSDLPNNYLNITHDGSGNQTNVVGVVFIPSNYAPVR